MDRGYGAYLITDNENTEKNVLFLYKKLSKQQLKNAVSSFDNKSYDNGAVYLGAVFKDGLDYIGQDDFNNIDKLIKSNGGVDLLNTDYSICKNIFPNLTKKQYDSELIFSRKQLLENNVSNEFDIYC